MTTGWNNEQAKDAVRRTLTGKSSGRLAVFLIAAAFLALGIYGGSVLLSVASGLVAVAAAGALVRAAQSNRAARQIERRYVGGSDKLAG